MAKVGNDTGAAGEVAAAKIAVAPPQTITDAKQPAAQLDGTSILTPFTSTTVWLLSPAVH